MIVLGEQVPDEAIAAARAVIGREYFGKRQVDDAIEDAWPEASRIQIDRTADRLIQQARKRGEVYHDGVMWRRRDG